MDNMAFVGVVAQSTHYHELYTQCTMALSFQAFKFGSKGQQTIPLFVMTFAQIPSIGFRIFVGFK